MFFQGGKFLESGEVFERYSMGKVGRKTGLGSAILRRESSAVVGFRKVGQVVWLSMVSAGRLRFLFSGAGSCVCHRKVLADDAGGNAPRSPDQHLGRGAGLAMAKDGKEARGGGAV